jgi:hypothetical protein
MEITEMRVEILAWPAAARSGRLGISWMRRWCLARLFVTLVDKATA